MWVAILAHDQVTKLVHGFACAFLWNPLSTVWNFLDVVRLLFDGGWLELRIFPVNAVNRTTYGYFHRARWWMYMRAAVERLGFFEATLPL